MNTYRSKIFLLIAILAVIGLAWFFIPKASQDSSEVASEPSPSSTPASSSATTLSPSSSSSSSSSLDEKRATQPGNQEQPESAAGGELPDVIPGASEPRYEGQSAEKESVMSVPSALKSAKEDATRAADTSAPSAKSNGSVSVATPSPSQSSQISPLPSPTSTADAFEKSNASLPNESCSEQWTAFANSFRARKDLVYMTSMSVQKPPTSDIALSHTEIVGRANSNTVELDLEVASDHPMGTLAIATIGVGTVAVTSKDNFISNCQSAGGRAVRSVLFKLARLKNPVITDSQVKVGAGNYAVYQMKSDATLVMNGKSVGASLEVWMAKNKPGLVVKQTLKIPAKAFSDLGAVTISSQLAGGTIVSKK